MMLSCQPDSKYVSKTTIAMTILKNCTTHVDMRHAAFIVGNMSMASKVMITSIHSATNARRIQFPRGEHFNLHFILFICSRILCCHVHGIQHILVCQFHFHFIVLYFVLR